jgi:hypothetical protein
MAISLIALALFISKLHKSGKEKWLNITIGFLVLSSVSWSFMPHWMGERNLDEIIDNRFNNVYTFYNSSIYSEDADDKIAKILINKIPKGARVASTADLMPLLSNRKVIIEVLHEAKDYFDVDYIFINGKNLYWGAGHYRYDEKKINGLIDHLSRNSSWELLHKESTFSIFKRLK